MLVCNVVMFSFTVFCCRASIHNESDSKSDVYSFGVLALEVIMGKHPAELISSLSTLEQSIELKELLDLRLPPPTVLFEKDVASVVKQALSCLHITPNCRPTMRVVSQALLKA